MAPILSEIFYPDSVIQTKLGFGSNSLENCIRMTSFMEKKIRIRQKYSDPDPKIMNAILINNRIWPDTGYLLFPFKYVYHNKLKIWVNKNL